MTRLSRRDILKLSAALLGGAAVASVRPLSNLARGLAQTGKPNFIVLVLDAMSARNLSLQGYARPTTPSLERFAQRCTVYHNHYSAGNFTTPGTASMLTGLYPWSHRALTLNGLIARSREQENIFNFLGDGYTRAGFSHNHLVHLLLGQVGRDLDILLERESFSMRQASDPFAGDLPNDLPVGYLTFTEFLGANKRFTNPGSLTLGLVDMLSQKNTAIDPGPDYPRGYPANYFSFFRIEDILGGLQGVVQELSSRPLPFFSYFHLLPPHAPYNPRREFLKPFLNDSVTTPQKPIHAMSELNMPSDRLDRLQVLYDSFIANTDFEVAHFIDNLESSGILDSTYLLITSDHGEMFERGFYGHGSPLMYEPVLRIPLIVHAPGQTERRDVYTPTSNVDLVPTILSLAGREIPDVVEGRILPGLGGTGEADRPVFSVYARDNSSFLPLEKYILAMRKGDHKLIYYRNYPGYENRIELYHLGEDPEELRDLAADDTVTAQLMKEEMLDHFIAAPPQRNR